MKYDDLLVTGWEETEEFVCDVLLRCSNECKGKKYDNCTVGWF